MLWDIKIELKNKRIEAETVGVFPLTGTELWTLLAVPESRPVFRVEDRKQLSCQDGVILETVVFVAPVRIVLWKKWARTEVHQTVDMSDPAHVTVDFKLLQSDMMSHLSGTWQFRQLQPPCEDSPGSTEVTYTFAMWPKGVPTALRFMPGLVEAVKAAVAREATQLFDKLAFVAAKVKPGVSLVDAARQAAAEVEAAGGSFKCLQLQRAGDAAAAAAAAAAEAAGRQELKQQHHQQQQQKVVCHALDDVSSEGDEDCLVALDSCGSTVSSTCGSSVRLTCSEPGSDSEGYAGRGCSSSGGSILSCSSFGGSGRFSGAGSVLSVSSGGVSTASGMDEAVLTAMSKSFDALLRPTPAN